MALLSLARRVSTAVLETNTDYIITTREPTEWLVKSLPLIFPTSFVHTVINDRSFAALLPLQAVKWLYAQCVVDAVCANGIVSNVPPSATNLNTTAMALPVGPLWHFDRINQRGLILDGDTLLLSDAKGLGVDIYIVDSGIRSSHNEFAEASGLSRLRDGKNFVGDEYSFTDDCEGHGSHVAGISAGNRVGVAPMANIVSVRVYGCEASGPLSTILQALEWVKAQVLASGRKSVINLSFGATASAVLDAAVTELSQISLVVAAAGNSDLDACGFSPARAPGCLTASSTGIDNLVSPFSNFGSCCAVGPADWGGWWG